MTRNKVFKSMNDLEINVKSRKCAVILELTNKKYNTYEFDFYFTDLEMNNLLKYIKEVSKEAWKDITPKECDSLKSDYWEYYDPKSDANAYLNLQGNRLMVERLELESKELYKFNKRRMQSFLYDIEKIIN